MSEAQPIPSSRAVFWLAVATTLAMFPLIWMGGLVTSKGAGMSVPDWPNTFGYNMWAVPWGQWVGEHAGGVFYEHAHRLLGTVVGFLALLTFYASFGFGGTRARRPLRRIGVGCLLVAVAAYAGPTIVAMTPTGAQRVSHLIGVFGGLGVAALAATFFRRPDPRAWVRWLSATLLGFVIVQGVLGGLRVVLVSTELAMVHGVFAQITLCLGGCVALATSRWWASAERSPVRGATWPTAILFLVCLAQLGVAAVMRHSEAGLAVPDFPLHFGEVLPPTDAASLEAANDVRRYDYSPPLAPVTLAQVWLHVAHRIGAAAVSVASLFVAWRLWRIAKGRVLIVLVLIGVQVTLGILTVWLAKPADLATLHVATGALLLLAVALTLASVARQRAALPVLRRSAAAVPAPSPATVVPA